MTDYEVAIVGGGPAGAATALFLAAYAPALARRSILLDAAAFPRDKICAGAIGGRALAALASIGVDLDVPHVSLRALGVRRGDEQLRVRARRPIGWVVRRRSFDAALLARVQQVEVRQGVRVDGLVARADHVSLRTDAGELSARVVVGADGVRSRVRRSLGFGRGHYYAQAVEVDTERRSQDDDDTLWFDLGPAGPGYLWDFPTPLEGQVRMCRGAYQLTHGTSTRAADVGSWLNDHLARLDCRPLGGFKRYAERGLGLHQPLAREGVLLVGEAAGIDPVLGEGIPQAILFGREVARYLASGPPRSFGDYRQFIAGTRVGLDLRIRAAAVPLVYGRGRPLLERTVLRSRALAHAGMRYFAGEHVPRAWLARAAFDLAASPLALLSQALGSLGRR